MREAGREDLCGVNSQYQYGVQSGRLGVLGCLRACWIADGARDMQERCSAMVGTSEHVAVGWGV